MLHSYVDYDSAYSTNQYSIVEIIRRYAFQGMMSTRHYAEREDALCGIMRIKVWRLYVTMRN